MDRLKELLEKWDWDYYEINPSHMDERERLSICMEELKDTMLLMEADKFTQRGKG